MLIEEDYWGTVEDCEEPWENYQCMKYVDDVKNAAYDYYQWKIEMDCGSCSCTDIPCERVSDCIEL